MPDRNFIGGSVHVFPSVYPEEAAAIPLLKSEKGEHPSPSAARALLQRKAHESQVHAATENVLMEYVKALKEGSTNLDTNVAMNTVSERMDQDKRVMNFSEAAPCNRVYSNKFMETRYAEQHAKVRAFCS